MVDHTYEGLRAMCFVAFNCIAFGQVWSSVCFFSRRKEPRMLACLLALCLVERARPASCCPDTLYKYLVSEHRFCMHTAFFWLERASWRINSKNILLSTPLTIPKLL